MKVLSYGSLNLDFVYTVPHFVQEGETLSSLEREVFPGGKGLNQSIALAKAGLPVSHAGAIGSDEGELLVRMLEAVSVDTSRISILSGPSGHAIIQRDLNGRNGILIFGGANKALTREKILADLQDFGAGDFLVLQNEINELPYLVDQAYAAQMRIVLNPSPLDASIFDMDLSKISVFLVNELEAQALLMHYGQSLDLDGRWSEPKIHSALESLQKLFPKALLVMTLGKAGSAAIFPDAYARCESFSVPVVDTTAAGDCFSGYFLAAQAGGASLAESLRRASAAAAIAVSRPGAAPSIPESKEVDSFLAKQG